MKNAANLGQELLNSLKMIGAAASWRPRRPAFAPAARRSRSWAALFAVPALLLGLLQIPAHGFVVTTSADSGPGSLRQAIIDANSNPGLDTIEFNLAPTDLVITPLTSLPHLYDPVIIDGTTQPLWPGSPLVELDGSVAGERGLSITAGNSTVAGLAIYNFEHGIVLSSNGSNHIRGCFIGTDATGVAPLGNSQQGIHVASDTNFIGGSAPGERNVIVDNRTGIWITSQGSSNVVVGNYIGVAADGLSPLGNEYGVSVTGNENYVGGTASGERNIISANERGITLSGLGAVVAGNWVGLNALGQELGNTETGIFVQGTNNRVGGTDPSARNVISGNTSSGIYISSLGSDNKIFGNYVGTKANGTEAAPNFTGVRVIGDNNQVGGTAAGQGNLISGNTRGVSVEADGNVVEGNMIGLNVTGTQAIGNSEVGVTISSGSSNRIGGTTPGAANTISANGSGVAIGGTSPDDNVVEGNFIGTNPVGNGNFGNDGTGVRVLRGTGNRIGGLDPAAGNVIVGSLRGITLERESFGSVVQGNIIGLNATATTPIRNRESGISITGPGNQVGGTEAGASNIIAGNRYYGVVLSGPLATGNTIEGNQVYSNLSAGFRVLNSFDNTIGGTTPGAGNTISNNGNWGVFVRSGTGNEILGNSIYGNDLLGIDHDPYGPTANDPLDADLGPNRGQNYPILDSALATATDVTIEGQLATEPDSTYRVEFFSSAICDPSGFGQGETFLGAATVHSNAAGIAAINATLPVSITDDFVSATATDSLGNTSEFSPCALVGGPNPGVIQFSLERTVAYEYYGDAIVSVSRSHGTAGTVSVSYRTFANTAETPDDYTDVSGTLTFGPGEVLKTFAVPVFVDMIDDHGDLIGLVLEDPTGGATLARAASEIWLGDADFDLPTVWLDDGEVVEGDAGTTQLAFPVRVSPSAVPVVVRWETMDGTALAGIDYEETSGELPFAPGESQKTVFVTVYGDLDSEDDEIFFIRSSGTTGASVTDAIAEGVIRDDDGAAPPPALCIGGTTIANPRLTLGALGGDLGNERAAVRGDLEFASGEPVGMTNLDMAQRGAQIRIEDLGTGTILWELTADTHAIPTGDLGPSPCDPAGQKKDGWRMNGNQTVHTYRNTTNALASAGCAPSSAEGLRRLTLKDRRQQHGQVRFSQVLRKASIATPVGPFRMTIVLGADAVAGQQGACGVHQFDPSDCNWNGTGTRMVCK